MPKSCPTCGSSASGKFCSHCGASLETPNCASCGNQIPEGGRFCNMCGTPVAAGAKRGGRKGKAAVAAAEPTGTPGSRNLPWIVAGAAVIGLGAVLVIQAMDSEPAAPAIPPPAAGAAAAPGLGGPGAVDLSSMTPREAADRLFNRVMTAVSSGDSAQARSFAPMAIAAYGMVPELDLDGRYHVAVIHLVNNQPEEALAVANSILAEAPNHLFGHFTAAEAEQMAGDRDAALAHYRHFLDNYEAELAAGRPEYADHQNILPGMRDQATQILAAG